MNQISRVSAVFLIPFFLAGQASAAEITGSVHFSGAAPAPESIQMNADPACAALSKGSAVPAAVQINAGSHTLKNVFVYVKEGLEGKTYEPPKEPVKLDQRGCMYEPRVFGIQVNQPLQIVNDDETLHNVHSLPEKQKPFNLGMPVQGAQVTKKFTAPEVMVAFKCDVHPWMRAYAGVLPHPFFSTTGDEGTFDIKDLPPGEYTLEAWHEKFGTRTQKVTVREGETAHIDFTFAGA